MRSHLPRTERGGTGHAAGNLRSFALRAQVREFSISRFLQGYGHAARLGATSHDNGNFRERALGRGALEQPASKADCKRHDLTEHTRPLWRQVYPSSEWQVQSASAAEGRGGWVTVAATRRRFSIRNQTRAAIRTISTVAYIKGSRRSALTSQMKWITPAAAEK
jgi:hypothetical protein